MRCQVPSWLQRVVNTRWPVGKRCPLKHVNETLWLIGRCVARCRPGYSEWWRRADQWENDVPWNMSTSRCDCLDGTSLSRFPRTAAPNNRLNNIHHNTATCPKCIGRKDAYNFNNDSSLTVIHHHHHHHHHCMIRCKSCPSSKNSERTDI